MRYLDWTLATPEANLACDEILLERCESDAASETLRFWAPNRHFIVLGISNRIALQVNESACLRRRIPILRRISGGGSILQGPGCLNFSLVFRLERFTELGSILSTNAFVLERNKLALQPFLSPRILCQGDSDLTLEGLKFSGSAQRRRKAALLFHGTFLLDLDLSLVEALLPVPERQPAYRKNRSHTAFLTNLPLPSDLIQRSLRKTWGADEPFPLAQLQKRQLAQEINALAQTRYGSPDWTRQP